MTNIIKELNPKLTGFLHLDGKGIKIKGKRKGKTTLFITQDSIGPPIHQNLMEGENKQAIMDFIDVLKKDFNYSFKGIISDMREDIIKAATEKMPKFLINSALLTF